MIKRCLYVRYNIIVLIMLKCLHNGFLEFLLSNEYAKNIQVLYLYQVTKKKIYIECCQHKLSDLKLQQIAITKIKKWHSLNDNFWTWDLTDNNDK